MQVLNRPLDAGTTGLEAEGSRPAGHSVSKSHADEPESDAVPRENRGYQEGGLAETTRLEALSDGTFAIVITLLVLSAAWLPAFIHLNRNQRLAKIGVPPGMFAAQIVRPAIGVLLYAGAGVLGWFVHPAFTVAIFVFMVCYYAATSRGVRTAQSHATQRHDHP
jgi:hypothetical protein